MKILRRKIKKFANKKLAKKQLAIFKDLKVSGKPKYTLCLLGEDNNLMTEKEIFNKDKMVEDTEVDSTQIHFCDHDEKNRVGCKLLNITKAKKQYENIKKTNLDNTDEMPKMRGKIAKL